MSRTPSTLLLSALSSAGASAQDLLRQHVRLGRECVQAKLQSSLVAGRRCTVCCWVSPAGRSRCAIAGLDFCVQGWVGCPTARGLGHSVTGALQTRGAGR